MKILRVFQFVMLTFVALGAQAQRTLVPIVSFENIPVAQATKARLTSEDVKNAFISAGEEARWKVVPMGEGALEGTYVKENHTIVVTIRYDAEKYSVLFKSSDKMNQRASQYAGHLVSDPGRGLESTAAQAERKQRELFANRPESAYRKADPQAVIHPYYERWVYDLLEKVRQKLMRSA